MVLVRITLGLHVFIGKETDLHPCMKLMYINNYFFLVSINKIVQNNIYLIMYQKKFILFIKYETYQKKNH
jgi:hypothetical protein